MTSLNNPELRKKIIETLHPERNGLLIKGGIAEGANHEGLIVDGLEKLIESELANRERVARIAELEVVKSQITEAHMILSPCGYRHTIEYILHPEIIEDRIAQLQSQLNKETT